MSSIASINSVTLALESATQVDDGLEVRGIDLDSGHRVSIVVRYETNGPKAIGKLNGLILTLSVIESPLTH